MKKKYYYDKNAKDKEIDINNNKNIVFKENNIWKPAEFIQRHKAPRSIILRDQNNEMKRRNEVDIKISRAAYHFKNKYWSNKKMNLNEENENYDKIETEDTVRKNSKLKTVSEEENVKYEVNRFGRKIQKVNYKI